MSIKIGDIVGRKSYQCDVAFKVHDILKQSNKETIIVLKGINLRIMADAPESDIVQLPVNRIQEESDFYKKTIKKATSKAIGINRKILSRFKALANYRESSETFKVPGKILHLDGDRGYLEMCLKSYKSFGLDAIGKMVTESEQPKVVINLLTEYKPDILVLTGHDGMIKGENSYSSISNYRSSGYFIEAVKAARKYEPSLDDLVIFAGACQSFFEGIITAGANYASSPGRIMIHALDPVMITKEVALMPIDKLVSLDELVTITSSGIRGIGGVQTKGKYRNGIPKPLYGKL